MNQLLGLPYSPWTDKARWALDARQVPYAFVHYQPLLGEPALRWKLKRPVGRVSVPVLLAADGRVIADSADIARWADGHGAGPILFPVEHDTAIRRYVDISERALSAGRNLSLERLLAKDDALVELVPRPMRRVRPLAVAVGGFGVRRTIQKYATGIRDREQNRAIVIEALTELRDKLQGGSGAEPRTIFGRLTFADIAMQEILVNVTPPSDMKIGRASREAFVDAALQERFADLLAWRDELARAHRHPR